MTTLQYAFGKSRGSNRRTLLCQNMGYAETMATLAMCRGCACCKGAVPDQPGKPMCLSYICPVLVQLWPQFNLSELPSSCLQTVLGHRQEIAIYVRHMESLSAICGNQTSDRSGHAPRSSTQGIFNGASLPAGLLDDVPDYKPASAQGCGSTFCRQPCSPTCGEDHVAVPTAVMHCSNGCQARTSFSGLLGYVGCMQSTVGIRDLTPTIISWYSIPKGNSFDTNVTYQASVMTCSRASKGMCTCRGIVGGREPDCACPGNIPAQTAGIPARICVGNPLWPRPMFCLLMPEYGPCSECSLICGHATFCHANPVYIENQFCMCPAGLG
jgi:hypothetical protein